MLLCSHISRDVWKWPWKINSRIIEKNAQNASEEVKMMRAHSVRKGRKVPLAKTPNKKLCHLSNINDLNVSGETLESCQRHLEWLQLNSETTDEADLRPRLLATAKERHERLRQLTLSGALLKYPFLAIELSVADWVSHIVQENNYRWRDLWI